jgi:peptidoglycan/xylan/chitin deacetylase (PgdA/CDA1 family)
MRALQDAGYSIMGLTEALASEAPMVAVTIDDGYADVCAAAEVLATLDARATLYVPSALVGRDAAWLPEPRPRLLSRAELRALAEDSPLEIGGHGRTHVPLDTAPAGVMWREVAGSRAELEDVTGRAVVSFAYPHGYANAAVRQVTADAGYRNACVLGHRRHSRDGDAMRVSRLLVTQDDTAESVLRRVRASRPPTRSVAVQALDHPWRLVRRAREWTR